MCPTRPQVRVTSGCLVFLDQLKKIDVFSKQSALCDVECHSGNSTKLYKNIPHEIDYMQ